MDIDLFKVIRYSKDSLQNRALMRSIMLDLYPDKTREMNVLLDVYESGVPRQIINDGTITDSKYAQYVQKIVDDYGMQEQWAVFGLNAWIDVCLGKGESAKITYKAFAESVSAGNAANGNLAGGHCTNPIVHTNTAPKISKPIQGSVSEYEIADLGKGTVVIQKFVGFDQADMVIPTEIDGKRVVGIGSNVFKQCKGIERLTVPEGIEYISAGAFFACDSLAMVILPTSLKHIGKDAFKKCRNIKQLTIPEGVEYISEGAFAGCVRLESVILPTSLKQIGKNGGAQTDSDGTFQATAITEIDMPNGITTIGESCFRGCRKLVKVLFPDNLTTIEECAFDGCVELQEVLLPSKVEKIGYAAFRDCCSLKTVELNEGLLELGSEAFRNCSKLCEIVLPYSLTNIAASVFTIDGKINTRGKVNPDLAIYCYAGSKGLEYARSLGIPVKDALKR